MTALFFEAVKPGGAVHDFRKRWNRWRVDSCPGFLQIGTIFQNPASDPVQYDTVPDGNGREQFSGLRGILGQHQDAQINEFFGVGVVCGRGKVVNGVSPR